MQKLIFALALACLSATNLSVNQLGEAQILFEAGKREQAMTKVNAYLEAQPRSAEARFLKGLILVEQENTKAAVKVFTALTQDFPELPEPYNNLAVIHAANGNYDSARQALQAALKTHPSYATAYENLGDIYAKLASEAYQQALSLEQSDRGKLQVKLSLISNLFHDESKYTIAARAPLPVVRRPAPAKVVASKPVVTKLSSPVPAAEPSARLIKTLHAWAAAWSAQDVDRYLSHYAGSFKPARGSVTKWRLQREERLLRPAFIRVGLRDIKVVKMNKTTARLELMQSYESNTYQDESAKRFDLILEDGGWRINRERGI